MSYYYDAAGTQQNLTAEGGRGQLGGACREARRHLRKHPARRHSAALPPAQNIPRYLSLPGCPPRAQHNQDRCGQGGSIGGAGPAGSQRLCRYCSVLHQSLHAPAPVPRQLPGHSSAAGAGKPAGSCRWMRPPGRSCCLIASIDRDGLLRLACRLTRTCTPPPPPPSPPAWTWVSKQAFLIRFRAGHCKASWPCNLPHVSPLAMPFCSHPCCRSHRGAEELQRVHERQPDGHREPHHGHHRPAAQLWGLHNGGAGCTAAQECR